MNKYLFFIIIGIILFILYNHIDSFSIGIGSWTIELTDAGKEAKGPPPEVFYYNDDTDKWEAYYYAELELQRLRRENPEYYTNDIIDNEADAVPEPCPQLQEGVSDRLCEPEPESCAASPFRNSLDGPRRCQQPQIVGTGLNPGGGGGGSGSRRTPCSQFLQTNAVRCFVDNPKIMRSLFEEYEQLSALLDLPVDQITQIQNVPGFESLTSTMETRMLRGTRGQEFFLIFDFIRRNCQLFRFDDVLVILNDDLVTLNGITLRESYFRGITDLKEIKRRSRIIIYILLFLIKCNFNNDFIKRILNFVIYSFFISNENTYNYRDILVYNILKSLFQGFVRNGGYQVKDAIKQYLQGDRFNDYIVNYVYNLWSVDENFTYEDYISLYKYLSDQCLEIMQSESGECSDIISALNNPIFRIFFGLPDP